MRHGYVLTLLTATWSKKLLGVEIHTDYVPLHHDKDDVFYLLVQSEKPEPAPVFLWLNGGPGCSSMEGAFSENGPFGLLDDGATLVSNDFSLHKLGHVIYLDQPVGVGLAKASSGGEPRNGDELGRDASFAVNTILQKHHLTKLPFYILGESYAGHYIPSISTALLRDYPNVNLKGIGVGNGFVNLRKSAGEGPKYLESVGLLRHESVSPYGQAFKACESMVMMEGLALTGMLLCELLDQALLEDTDRPFDVYDVRRRHSASFASIEHFLNNSTVKNILNLKPDREFTLCKMMLTEYRKNDYTVNMAPVYAELAKRIKVALYYGDQDFICNYMGGLAWFCEEFDCSEGFTKWQGPEAAFGEVMAATAKDSDASATFYRVYASGHMVPEDRPESFFDIVGRLVADDTPTPHAEHTNHTHHTHHPHHPPHEGVETTEEVVTGKQSHAEQWLQLVESEPLMVSQ
ncbi:MAG: uncharacterized protein KVP18_001984 [Porospora cf. gigantea A]|uniref:uncharacterized protein n=1 Tax=Porospora cf. gigantea A TaxID=2853593 RepID=UPI0035594A86|nr:MAG: hypothetical protein KVP18_001984 [Porospora cf. gigantea A]